MDRDHGHLNNLFTATTNTPGRPQLATTRATYPAGIHENVESDHRDQWRVSVYVNTMRHTIGSDMEITVFGGVWARGSLLTRLNPETSNADREAIRDDSNSRAGSRGRTPRSRLKSGELRIQRACPHVGTADGSSPSARRVSKSESPHSGRI